MAYSKEEHLEWFKKIAKGDKDAYEYMCIMAKVFRSWDDLYDKDKEVTPDQANEVMAQLNFELSRNQFYVKYYHVLAAFTLLAWNAWMDSNEWKGVEDKSKGICAFFLRDMCNELEPLVAWLVGGKEHVRSISIEYREFCLDRLLERGSDKFF